MARPQRFSLKEEYWTTPEQCERLDQLVAAGLLARADHHRLAMDLYLIHNGLPPLQPRPNGHHQEVTHHGL